MPGFVTIRTKKLSGAARRGLLGTTEHFHARENARRRRMSAANGLVRLALAAQLRAVHLESRLIPHGTQAAPERGGDPTIVGVLHHAGAPAVLDALAPLAAELKFVPRVVDRPRDV